MPRPGPLSGSTTSPPTASRVTRPRRSGPCSNSTGAATPRECSSRTSSADAFCHSMVRALVGACVAVGEGRLDVEDIVAIRDAGERVPEVKVLAARGLTLTEVGYPADGSCWPPAQSRPARAAIASSSPGARLPSRTADLYLFETGPSSSVARVVAMCSTVHVVLRAPGRGILGACCVTTRARSFQGVLDQPPSSPGLIPAKA